MSQQLAPDTTLRTIYNYRVALHDAQQRGACMPTPPALSADALVDAYGAQMNRYGATYMTFGEWYAAQQEPQPPRRFSVVGGW